MKLQLNACRFSKVLALLYLTLGLVIVGGLGIFAVTGESLYDACWQVRGHHHTHTHISIPRAATTVLRAYGIHNIWVPLPIPKAFSLKHRTG
jgi:hypothetical protein